MSTKDYWICSVCGKGVSRQPQHKELRVRAAMGWDHTRCHTSAVVQEPGKLELLSVEDAKKITLEIKQRVTHVWELISQAYHRRAWSALGYESWDSYTEAEFGSLRLRLPREERAEVVTSLRESGLSIRAISAATQTSVNTVQRDLAEVYQSDTPEPDAEPPGAPTDSTPGMTDRVHAALGKATQTITGKDGKKYPKPKPKPTPTIPKPIALDEEAEAVLADVLAGIDTIAKREAVVIEAVRKAADALAEAQRFTDLAQVQKTISKCRDGWAELALDVNRALGKMLKETS